MKNLKLYTILIVVISLLPASFCYSQDYTRWHLPEGAIQRFGKGIIEDIAYFPDGNRIAVSSSIGIWNL